MKRVLAAAVLVAFMPTANAQDKGKADFSTNAEFRARYFQMQNPGGDEDTLANRGMGQHRLKLDLNYKANEKVSGHGTLVHRANWGQSVNADDVGTTEPFESNTDGDNALAVNQAFVRWMSSDDLSFNVGRMNFGFADGFVMGVNDWEQMPYAFEGLLVNWEAEFGKFNFFGYKAREIAGGAGTSASGDPEHNMYGIVFDLKSRPEWLKGLNVHVIKNAADAVIGGTAGNIATTTEGVDALRYGLMAGFGFGDFDLKAWWANHTGKHKTIAAGGAKTETDAKGDMMQAALGYTAANFMSSRFQFMWHKDSGDSANSANENGTYDAFFTEKHNSAGMMDLFGWGNLTFMQLSWTMKPQDKTEVGLQYTMFSRTESDTGVYDYTPGLFGGDLPGGAGASGNDKDKLGDEIDVWATHTYDANLSTTLRLGYFMPGDHFSTNNGPDDAVMHVMLEGKATF